MNYGFWGSFKAVPSKVHLIPLIADPSATACLPMLFFFIFVHH